MVIEIIHQRDPDDGCHHRVFVDGLEVTDVTVADVDPGRGHDARQWHDTTRALAADDTRTEAFRAATTEARDQAASSDYID